MLASSGVRPTKTSNGTCRFCTRPPRSLWRRQPRTSTSVTRRGGPTGRGEPGHRALRAVTAASLGLLVVTAATPLWLIALILACRPVSVGLVINPLLQALTQPLRPDQLGDANTSFNTWQRIAGSFGIGLVAALYATQARTEGPVAALHAAGLVLVAIALAGALGALILPAVRNTALARG
jgi:hypothetical protein